MARLYRQGSKKVGVPPGTIVHVGDRKAGQARITLFDYDPNNYTEKELNHIEECFLFKDKPSVTWLNVDGLSDVDLIQRVDSHFGVHPLVLEDIVNTGQRPKMDDYGEYIYIVLRMLSFDEKQVEIDSEQISLILGNNYVFSFQETAGDCFNRIRDRIRFSKGRVRRMGADYLIYALIDSIVDDYFVVLEKIGEKIEALEEHLISDGRRNVSAQIHHLKREIILLRRMIWPLREVISVLQKSESPLLTKSTVVYFRDLYGHTVQIIDTIESFRDVLTGLHDIHISTMSQRTSEIMRVLTVITTLFIPLTFIVGVYGMNFRYMPELEWPWAYFVLLGFMLTVSVGQFIFFKRKGWL